jgi:uncharacterized membrane protein
MTRRSLSRWDLGSMLVTACTALGTALVYARLPDEVPIHFDIHGHADGFASRALGAWLMPAVMALVGVFLHVMSQRKPKADRAPMALVTFLTTALVGALHFIMLRAALSGVLDAGLSIGIVLAVFSVAVGLALPRLRRNPWAGIRTPWTLASDEAWARSHRVGGALFVLGGVAALVFVMLGLPSFAIGTAVTAILATLPASWLASRRAA